MSETGWRRSDLYSVTGLFMAMCVIVFVLQLTTGEPTSNETLYRFGAASPRHVWDGEVWRVLTSTLVHIGPIHLLFNMVCLWILGRVAESLLGQTIYLLFALGAAIFSGAAMVLFEGAGAGFSGVGYAIFGYLLTLKGRSIRVDAVLSKQWTFLLLAIIPLGYLMSALGNPIVANTGHLAGLTYGLGVGGCFRYFPRRGPKRWAAGIAFQLLCGTVVAYSFMPIYSPGYHFYRGNVHFKAGAWPQAEASYRRAIDLDPGLDDARYNLVLTLKLSNEYARAVEVLDGGFDGSSRQWRTLAAYVYSAQENAPGLARVAEQAFQHGPRSEVDGYLMPLELLDPDLARSIRKKMNDERAAPENY